MTGAFSGAVNGNKGWFPEIDDIPVLQKRIAVQIVFSQNRNIPIYRLYRPSLMRKYIFAQESFYLQGILNYINEKDTSFLDCKHKHMMKSGAPPDKFGVLYRIFKYRIPWFHKQNYI